MSKLESSPKHSCLSGVDPQDTERDKKPMFAVEVKTSDANISKSLHYFALRTPIPQFYQVHLGTEGYEKNGIRVLPFSTFCRL